MQLSDVFLMIEADFLQPFFFKAILSASSSRDEAMSPPSSRGFRQDRRLNSFRPSETKARLSSAISIYYNIIMTDQSHFAVRLICLEARVAFQAHYAVRDHHPCSELFGLHNRTCRQLLAGDSCCEAQITFDFGARSRLSSGCLGSIMSTSRPSDPA